MNLNELTVQEAAAGLRKKEFTALDLTSECLEAVKEKNKKTNAFLSVFEETALAEARKADEILATQTNPPPLLGIPLAIKDNILIEGRPCTAGSKILENYIASYDAAVIQKLKNQGAVFLGKTNLDEFAMGGSTENSAFGPTLNPHDLERIPGGSSGGSAAAVAAQMCVAALGSDTGGSIRQPASFCGIVGLKPTYGRISRHGLIAMTSSLDQIGPMTKTVGDAKILWEAISGKDLFDSTATSPNENSRPPATDTDTDFFKKIRIGVPKEYFTPSLDKSVKKIIEDGFKKLEDAGAKIKEISLPHSEYALATYYLIVPSEVSANLARFDGVRYGLRQDAENLFEVYGRSRASGFGDEVKRRIMLGTYALSAGYYDAYYLKAQKVRRLIQQDFERAFAQVDVIAGPTTPTPAFRLGEKTKNPLEMYLADIYTVGVNLAGLPAISLPAGFVEKENKKLPAGLQLIGKWFEEDKLLGIAESAEKILRL